MAEKDDKWIDEKARGFMADFGARGMTMLNYVQDFIRQIVAEIPKPKVSKKFVGKVVARVYCNRKSSEAIKTIIREAFEKAGVEVSDER